MTTKDEAIDKILTQATEDGVDHDKFADLIERVKVLKDLDL